MSAATDSQEMKPRNKDDDMDLDQVLLNFGFGPYQLLVCVLMGFVVMFSNVSIQSYVITASDLKYRCQIPQCDNDNSLYNSDWLEFTVPFKKNTKNPYKCLKFVPIVSSNNTDVLVNSTCKPTMFNPNSVEACSKWVFGDKERTIVNDFGIMCEENKWKLSIVGTINSLAQFIGIPIAGFISDKYGRKSILIIGSVVSSMFGLLRSFTRSYDSFLLFEFLDSMVSSGIYGATFVLGLELVSPKSRVMVSTLMGCFYPIGGVIMGLIAYLVLDWRITLRILYLPRLLILGYAWCVPESLRWLQSQSRTIDMFKVLTNIAKSKGKALTPKIKASLILSSTNNGRSVACNNKMSVYYHISNIFSSKKLFLRLVNCSFCWFTITLVYYGLSLASVEFSDDKYINFMLVNFVEVPAFFLLWFTMERYSRKYVQALSFLFSGFSCILVNVISGDYLWLQLLLFLSSRFAISMAFNNMYVYTAEMFPTELRMTLCGIASMFGRLGSMLAPQMSLLAIYFASYMPVLTFGFVSFVAGVLAFFLPETKDKKLPDTVEEAGLVGVE